MTPNQRWHPPKQGRQRLSDRRPLSYNVIALAASDFNKQPITFALKDKGDCRRLIYDPSSRLAASPAKGGAVLFDARTGAEVSGRLPSDQDPTDTVIHDLAFSGDGGHLIFIASRNGCPRYVKSVALVTR